MSYKRQAIFGGTPKVPAYIVTFSDMVTLLLTFFVMLLSLAEVPDEGLFYAGRESFLASIRRLGLGIFAGRKPGLDFGHIKIKYFIGTPDRQFDGRTIDARTEELRRIFNQVDRSMTAMPSHIVAKKTSFAVTNIRFPPGQAALNEPAKTFLTEFAFDLQQRPDASRVKLYVLGLAADAATEEQQWILSARRAQAVADFLQDMFSYEQSSQTRSDSFEVPLELPVYSWGAGPGGHWVDQDSPIYKQSQILIAVLSAED
ncbi:MAG: OmpA family protein [Planctomycetota bacterium]|nr:MAG: OmpA family protein [Planctomycetota bacterium]